MLTVPLYLPGCPNSLTYGKHGEGRSACRQFSKLGLLARIPRNKEVTSTVVTAVERYKMNLVKSRCPGCGRKDSYIGAVPAEDDGQVTALCIYTTRCGIRARQVKRRNGLRSAVRIFEHMRAVCYEDVAVAVGTISPNPAGDRNA